MSAMSKMNKNNSAVKRIMQEAQELAHDPCTDYFAAPLEDDIFEWHCTIRGPSGTEFEGGLYHFRILLPAEYPFRPPSIMVLTPNGRFELNTKICISFTNYHEELWQPAWGVRTAILGLQGFFPLKGQAAIGVGSIEYPASERRRLAALSREWVCPRCKEKNITILPNPLQIQSSSDSKTEAVAITDDADTSSTQPNISVGEELHSVYVARSSGMVMSSHSPSNALPVSRPLPSTRPNGLPPPADSPTSIGAANISPAQTTLSSRQVSVHRPLLFLDTIICVLLVLVVALICRRLT